MSQKSTQLLKAVLSAMHYSGASRLLEPVTRGRGIIFMLHQVLPSEPKAFEPNRILKVTPAFLDEVIGTTLDSGFDIVTLDEAAERIESKEGAAPFACFTFDDGYADNRDYALPLFRKYDVPFTIYVPSNYPDGTADLWWLNLEASLAKAEEVAVVMNGNEQRFDLSAVEGKWQAFNDIYWWLRKMPEREARTRVAEISEQAGHDPKEFGSKLIMRWDELRELADDPLVTIGAHTCNHFALAKLEEAEARNEMAESVRVIEEKLGRPCRHFSYPYGDAGSAGPREFAIARELGLRTAVTTRKGLVHAHHAQNLTSLPRLSLNGDFQDMRYVKVLMSGLPFAALNTIDRLLGRRAA